eukprot:scaffold864_cov36-Cyclotella_meneghiniana.AAC.4
MPINSTSALESYLSVVVGTSAGSTVRLRSIVGVPIWEWELPMAPRTNWVQKMNHTSVNPSEQLLPHHSLLQIHHLNILNYVFEVMPCST